MGLITTLSIPVKKLTALKTMELRYLETLGRTQNVVNSILRFTVFSFVVTVQQTAPRGGTRELWRGGPEKTPWV